MFETLAGVRAYYGNEIMSEPKGLPSDVTDVVKRESDAWGSDGHSHSWFTYKELIDWQKTHQYVRYHGMISPEDAEKLDKYGETPKEWCQWTNRRDYVERSWTEQNGVLDKLIEVVTKKFDEEFWIYEWMSDEDKNKQRENNAENFRIVFWFDN